MGQLLLRWSIVDILIVTPLIKRLVSPLLKGINCKWLLGWGGDLSVLPLLYAGILSVLYLCKSCVHCHDLREFICASVSGKCCFLGVIRHLWFLRSFLSPLLHRSLSLERWGLINASHLSLSAPRSLTVCTLPSCGSLC